MPPKTSVILCTYNEANYIENTISELEKNIKNLEIIIVTILLLCKYKTTKH